MTGNKVAIFAAVPFIIFITVGMLFVRPASADLVMYMGSVDGKAFYVGYRYSHLQNWIGADFYCKSHNLRLASIEGGTQKRFFEKLFITSHIVGWRTTRAFWLSRPSQETDLSSSSSSALCPMASFSTEGLQLGREDCYVGLADVTFCEADEK